mmetsp:Transcript_42499/g.95977  ORF Transcript_42499/g.95977 Transcript_42499/m.95977 type:complete len:214 (+) Transcript_42499:1236-1877(+)
MPKPVTEFLKRSFFPVNSCGILMNMPSVRSPGPFLYVTVSRILRPAPPHLAFSASCFVTSSAFTSNESNLMTSLSLARTPVVCIAFVSHFGPMSRSICGVYGKSMPQYSPGALVFTTALNSFIFLGLPPSPSLGKTSQMSGGMGDQSGLPLAAASAASASALALASAARASAFSFASASACAFSSASTCTRSSSASLRSSKSISAATGCPRGL